MAAIEQTAGILDGITPDSIRINQSTRYESNWIARGERGVVVYGVYQMNASLCKEKQ